MAVLTVIRLSEAALIWADRPLGAAVSRQLDTALQNLLDEGVSPLVIDLVRVTAIDTAVVEVLAQAAEDAGQLDLALHLRLPGGRRAVVRDEVELRHAISQAYPRAA
ncbi:hypothetical protein GCM10010123_25980 [Pilimelia anulata]|uniref:STAS domain-containing protein n=1 Tax=Pilimelia anulata TaxID=53371 RepID=A0A8J3B7H2_9ACTN|nr:STAS domain-containing protein [Pilimelia anulata]GGJ94988.1 hypothetical protein GCM10010123_25980 [Pilimelia anulata]